MRIAADYIDSETIFYTFDGLSWAESGRTSWGGIGPNNWVCVGGNNIRLYQFGQAHNSLHTVRNGEETVCTRNIDRKYSLSRVFYVSRRLIPLYINFRRRISCGDDFRWVNANIQGNFTRSCCIYKDGQIYMQNDVDSFVETDIPVNFVRLCDTDVKLQRINMREGILYAFDTNNLLWCRDLRSPDPFSIDIGWSCYKNVINPIMTNDGYILATMPNMTMQIADIRYSIAHYEVSIEEITGGRPNHHICALPD